MAWCECAAAISAEMNDWVRLGGGNSGCCGNAAHTYGFHLPGSAVSTRDYSRSHEPGRPYNMSWACAGDFSHNNNASLRARHEVVLARLMRGELPMICEFIGKPWPNKPVYYWCRWAGIGTLKQYTGSGHDTWSHISWWRSRANERAYLWTGASPVVTPVSTTAPPYPGYTIKYNPNKTDANLKVWQTQMKARGWRIVVDGIYGPDTKRVVLAFQTEKRLGVDGEIGPITWRAAWTSPIS
jgi:hypothetical protein